MPGAMQTPLWGKATIWTSIRSARRAAASATPSMAETPLSVSTSTWVRMRVAPLAMYSSRTAPARTATGGSVWRTERSFSMRPGSDGVALWGRQGRPQSVLSRCAWPSTRPGRARHPCPSTDGPAQSTGPSPIDATRPPLTAMSTHDGSLPTRTFRTNSSDMPADRSDWPARGSCVGPCRATNVGGRPHALVETDACDGGVVALPGTPRAVWRPPAPRTWRRTGSTSLDAPGEVRERPNRPHC